MSFDEFINSLTKSNLLLNRLVDFKKVEKNLSKIEIKLNQLNYLLGKNDLKKAISILYKENKNCFEILPILVAVRNNIDLLNNKKIEDYLKDEKSIYKFFKETNLDIIFKDKKIKNLVDYVFGIEVGLDTNARKNRNGKIMSEIIEKEFIENNIKYQKEISSKNFDLNLGNDIKRFDFVIKKDKIYLIEVNFYNGRGSKLNEVARSYTDIAQKIDNKKYQFVWITDGEGWLNAKNKIEEAFKFVKIYNLSSLNEFISELK